MADIDSFTTITKPSAQVVAEALIEYAQTQYEEKKIGWNSYAAHALGALRALCGDYDDGGPSDA